MQRDRASKRSTGAPSSPSRQDIELADSLERLSVEDAERVLERAIAFQAQLEMGPDRDKMLDRGALERIAEELDISREHLERAIVEEFAALDDTDLTWLDRLIGPEVVRARGVAPLSAEDTRAVIELWMTRHEGMRKRSARGDTTRWERDNSLAASARRALRMSQSSGRLRNEKRVATKIRPATDDQTVVVAEVDMSGQRFAYKLTAAIFAALAAIGIGTVAVQTAVGGAPDVATTAAVATGATLTAGGVMLGLRMWGRSVKQAVQNAVEAMTSITDPDDVATGGVGELVSEWTGLIADVRGELKKKRKRPR